MLIEPLNERVKKQIATVRLREKFNKQSKFFEANPSHPSLNTEKLEPKSIGLYSFRIDRTYRAIFRVRDGVAEILHITKHYRK